MKKHIIGIDIGGTKITGIVYDGKKILRQLTIVTPKTLFEFERNLIKLCDFLSSKQKISAVGVGMAGLVESKTGNVRYSPNIKYINNLNLVKFFKLNGFKNVKVDNDANCFTRAEMLVGQGRKFNNFLSLTLGTGIGGGIVVDKKIYRGESNAGGELGHLLENGKFIEKYFQKTRESDDYKGMGGLVGRGFASFVNIFAPDAIILGGSVSQNAASKFLPFAKREMKKYLFDAKANPLILVSKLKNAGALGAALLFK